MKIGQKGISRVAIVVIAVAVVVVVGAVLAVVLLKPGEGPASGGPTTPTTPEEGYLGDVEPYVKQEGITKVWDYRNVNVYVTIGNSGEAGVVAVTFQCSRQETQTEYIYLDKGEEKRISFKIYEAGWYGSRYGEEFEYTVTVSPTPAVYIQGKPGQDYIPELSNIEIVADVSEGVKVDVLFSDDKGRILAFEGIPVDVTVKVYTEKDVQIYEKTVTIDSYKDASSRLGGEEIEVPFDSDLKDVGFVEVIVHTSKGDFKDEVRV